MLELFRKFFRRATLYRECPRCYNLSLQWQKDIVHHPDEPPLFSHWSCKACGFESSIEPTQTSHDAAGSLGYKDFYDYAEKVVGIKR